MVGANSFCPHVWSPSVIASAPAAKISLASAHAELAPDAGQLLLQYPAAGASHHVADHQHLHAETSGDAVQSATSGAPRFSKQLIGVTVKRNARPGSSSRANTQYDGAVAFLCAAEWL